MVERIRWLNTRATRTLRSCSAILRSQRSEEGGQSSRMFRVSEGLEYVSGFLSVDDRTKVSAV